MVLYLCHLLHLDVYLIPGSSHSILLSMGFVSVLQFSKIVSNLLLYAFIVFNRGKREKAV